MNTHDHAVSLALKCGIGFSFSGGVETPRPSMKEFLSFYSAVRAEALKEAAEVCRKERVSLDCGDETDEAYNRAIGHCMSAILQLQTKEGRA